MKNSRFDSLRRTSPASLNVQTVTSLSRFRKRGSPSPCSIQMPSICFLDVVMIGSMEMPIYLDGFASLPLAPEALDAMAEAWSEPGNAASPNMAGERAARRVAEGRADVAALIAAAPSEIFFTSGATEANNLALLGGARAARSLLPDRRRIIVSAIEHKAVLEPARRLAKEGFDIRVAPVAADGRLDLAAFAALATDDVLLASVMLVNNETGVIQPAEAAAAILHRAGGFFHCDAAQALGKIAIDVGDLGADYLSLSAHKCYGPVGIGALFVAAGAPKPASLVYGGGQQEGVRPGTEPAPLIAGFGAAARVAATRRESDALHASASLDSLLGALAARQLRFEVATGESERVAGGAALYLPGIDADRVCAVVARNVSLSTGSACTSGQLSMSHVLEAIGYSEDKAQSVLRLFCHRYLTEDDISAAADHIVSAAERSRLATGEVRQ